MSWALYTRDPGVLTAPGVADGVSPWRDGSGSKLLWTDGDADLMSIVSWSKIWHATEPDGTGTDEAE